MSLAFSPGHLSVVFEMDAAPPLRVRCRGIQEPVYEDECVELFWAGAGPAGRYTEIVVNPLGTLYTARIHNPHGSRESWTVSPCLIPDIAVRIDGEPADAEPSCWTRWRCRMDVPWSSLSPGEPIPLDGALHRGNLFRIARGRAVSFEALSPTGRVPPDFHVPSRFALFRIGHRL